MLSRSVRSGGYINSSYLIPVERVRAFSWMDHVNRIWNRHKITVKIIRVILIGSFMIIMVALSVSGSTSIGLLAPTPSTEIPKVIHIVHRHNLCDDKVSSDELTSITQYGGFPYFFELSQNVQRIRAWNPEYSVKCWDNGMAHKYIADRDEQIALHFKRQRVQRYKTDIFRAFVLFHEGGVVMDAALEPTMPLQAVLDSDPESTFWSVIDAERRDIFQYFVAAKRGHPVLALNLKILERHYSLNLKFPENAGGVMMTEAVRRFTKQHDLTAVQRTKQYGIERIHLMEERKEENGENKVDKKVELENEWKEHLIWLYGIDDLEGLEDEQAVKHEKVRWLENRRSDLEPETKVYDAGTDSYPFLSRATRYDTEHIPSSKIAVELYH